MGEKQGGRYGALIKQAKQAPSENQLSGQPENQTNEPLDMVSAQEPDSQMPGQPDNQKTSLPAPDEKQVNLCVKVPESLRRHWAIQAKIHGVTMTAVMVEALTERFGKPDDQMTS